MADVVMSLLGGYTPQSSVVIETFKVIRTFAALGKVIVVGRGGACLTRGLPQGLHLRLVGSLETRVRRMQRLLQASKEEAARRIHESDQARARLVKTHFGRDVADPLLYHMVWSTDVCPVDEIASAALRLIESRAGNGAAREGLEVRC